MSNNCESCRYKGMIKAGDGHCYMFRTEPETACGQHSSLQQPKFIATGNAFGTFLVVASLHRLMMDKMGFQAKQQP